MFVVLVNFLSSKWEPKHVIIKLFKMFNTSGVTMAPRLQQFLDKFSLTQKILTYVKDEDFYLQTCAIALNFVVLCASLAMMEPFDGLYFGHALSKVC